MDARNHIQTTRRRNKKYRSRHRHKRGGRCAAAVRAMTAAKLYLAGSTPSLEAAAFSCGTNPAYVRAAIVLLRSENATLLSRVLRGDLPLLAAAAQVKRVANLVEAYRTASAGDRVAFARTVGSTVLFDTTLVPAI
jgi:hypothetical protein